MNLINKQNKKLYNDLIQEMLEDYMVEDFTYVQMSEKYHIAVSTVQIIVKDHQFKKKKLKFQDQLLNKKVDKLSTRHTRMLSRLTTIMEEQVERLQLMQRRDKSKVLDPNRMKEVLTAFALISKEHRLNTDQPTENSNITITVEMGGNIPLISENHIINKNPHDVEVESTTVIDDSQIETPAVEEVMEVIVEGQDEDDFVFGDIK